MPEFVGAPPEGPRTPEIVLHIGAPKTATSAVQSLLSSSRQALSLSGVAYPDLGVRFNAHHGLVGLIVDHESAYIPEPDADETELRDELERLLRGGARQIILSSEGFLSADRVRPFAEVLLKLAKVRIVLVVRPLLSWANALMNQRFKMSLQIGETPDQATLAKRVFENAIRFDRKLEIWAGAFGSDAVTIACCDQGDDFLAATLTALGLSATLAHDARPDAENRSLSLDALRYVIAISAHQAEFTPQQRNDIMRKLTLGDPGADRFSLIPSDFVETARDIRAEVVASISNRWFGGRQILREDFDDAGCVEINQSMRSAASRVSEHLGLPLGERQS